MSAAKSHLDRVRNDAEYSEILAGWDSQFYAKFTRLLRPDADGARVLDVGCGVGQVVARLLQEGFETHGVDVAEANLVKARLISTQCIWYDGRKLPYPDSHFASTGALNVLEHVEAPEEFMRELVRVTAPGGKIVISSPNFYRVLGWRDYHPHMRGIGQKFQNARALLEKLRRQRQSPGSVQFTRMKPIIKEPFTPDDDAIVAINLIDMRFFLERYGCRIECLSCTDRDVPGWLDWLVNLTPLRYGMLNALIVARKAV